MKHTGACSLHGSLAAACERALVTGARNERAGTRQQLRAAARRFVRRYGRDEGYLRWVLRSVGASSALAVALLGLAEPAHAKLAPFGASGGAAVDIGLYATVTLGDLDRDGDLDAVTGESDGILSYLENIGSAPGFVQFTERTGAANPIPPDSVGSYSAPALGDLDGDGDLDLVVGSYNGDLRYFENTGGATLPAFVQRTGAANPLDGLDLGARTAPALGDLDRDGDLDIVVGEDSGVFLYLENTGDANAPAFVQRSGSANPFTGQDVGDRSLPALGDLDGDGDLDLVSGTPDGSFDTFENTGGATSAAFVARTGASDPLAGLDVGNRSSVALGDFDLDGDPDLVAGAGNGFVFLPNENLSGEFVARTGSANPLPPTTAASSRPTLGDLDADGDLDLVTTETSGAFAYFANTGSATNAAFVAVTGSANPLQGQSVPGAVPTLVDLDDDGDLDLVTGSTAGAFSYFENTGSSASPLFVPRTGASNPFVALNIPGSAPAFGDLDGDGDRDLVSGRFAGDLRYFENTGGNGSPAFVERMGSANPFESFDLGGYSMPTLGDVDGDGDLDCLAGASQGNLSFLENTRSATAPAFRTKALAPLGGFDVGAMSAPTLGDLDGDGDLDLASGAQGGALFLFESFLAQQPKATPLSGGANPLAGADVGAFSAPALADLDSDGDADLIVGEDLGTFLYYENTGSAAAPSYIARTGAANPLDGRDVGDRATPALADLDADGDLDLLSGRLSGDFEFFPNIGSATAPVFDPPIANPFGLSGVCGDSSAPAFGDLDADGDLDLAVGCYDGFAFFLNTGSPTEPGYLLRTGAGDPFDGIDSGSYAVPALADFDGDGDLDLMVGGVGGQLRYFRNEGTVLQGTFVRHTGPANPLAGADVGQRSAPAAADLDGNGTPDLVTGALAGSFAVHYLPEPGQGTMLGAGIAILRWLAGLRRRRH